jgi:hypothetical protein
VKIEGRLFPWRILWMKNGFIELKTRKRKELVGE